MLILLICERLKAFEVAKYIYIIFSFFSIVFYFKRFDTISFISLINLEYILILLLAHGLYLLINKDFNSKESCRWYHLLPLILLCIDNHLFHLVLIISVLVLFAVNITDKIIKIKVLHLNILTLLVCNFFGVEHVFLDCLFFLILLFTLFEKVKKEEFLIIFSTFAMVSFSSLTLKFLCFLLIVGSGFRYYIDSQHYIKIKSLFLKQKYFERVLIKFNLFIGSIEITKKKKDVEYKNEVRSLDLAGIKFDIEFILLFVIFIYMVII
jgi:hypothetical protein